MEVLFHAYWEDISIYRVRNNTFHLRKGPAHDDAATYTMSVDGKEVQKVFFTKRDGPENFYGAWVNYSEECFEEIEVDFESDGPHVIQFESKEDDVGQVAFGAVSLYGPEPYYPLIEHLEAEQVRETDLTGTFMLQCYTRRTIVHKNLNAAEPDRIGSSLKFRFNSCPKGHYRIRIYYYSKKQKGLYEIFYLIKGKGQYMVDGKAQKLHSGCMVLTRQDEDRILMLDPEVESEYVTVEFRLSFLESIDKELKLLWPFVARVNGICLYDEYQIPDHLSQMLCGIGLRESWDVYIQRVSFLIRIQQMLFDIYHIFLPLKNPELPKFAPDLVDRAVQRIHEYLFEEMNLETLAKSFFVSKSNLNYLFRKKYNCSVHAYILQQRLLAARGKIQNGMSASDACHHCGFKEYSTFYRQYKKYFGISPKEEKLCNLTTF